MYKWKKRDFEWNSDKNTSNIKKHKVSFKEIKKLWNDPNATIKRSQQKDLNESRYLIIGKLEKKVYLAAFTIREEKIRIISARPASKDERISYEKKSKDS